MRAQQLDGGDTHPPFDVTAAHLLSVTSHGATGAVELSDTHPYYVRLSHVHNGLTPAGNTLTPSFFLRPIGAGVAGVIAAAQGGALPMRIRVANGQWWLDQDACTWLSLLVGSKLVAQDRAVQCTRSNRASTGATACG